MPPKRAANLRPGPIARSSSPQAMDAKRPDVPTKHSWGYGASTGAPVIPRQMSDQSGLKVADMAASIESGVKHAQDRDYAPQEDPRRANERSRRNPRSTRRSVSAGISPVRRTRKREATPDQMQLLGTLREVTVSPNFNTREDVDQQDQSTATPSPPIPHTLSSTSSPSPAPPGYPILPSNESLYPSPLLRLGSPILNGTPSGSSQLEGPLDNESIISWNVERDIHEDDLQRTHPAGFREEPQGKNITAPPRRFSGRAFGNETIQEEDEPFSEPSIEKSPTPIPPPPKLGMQSATQSRPRSESRSERRDEPDLSSAPTRTIIPRPFTRETSFHDPAPPSPESPVRPAIKSGKSEKSAIQSTSKTSFSFRQAAHVAAILLLAALSIFSAYWFSDSLANIPRGISSRFPFGKQSPYIPWNATGMDAINSLGKHVARIDTRVSSLSGELETVRLDVKNIPPPTTVVQPAPIRTATPIPRQNFLTEGMGAIVEPHKTSPTVGRNGGFLWRTSKRVFDFCADFLFAQKEAQGPLSALTHWDDVGDCWCSVPDSGVSQLSVALGRQIVPEEVVVEHIHRDVTLNPGMAPREMELWARFVIRSDDSAANRPRAGFSSWLPSSLSSSKKSPERPESSVPSDQFSLHERVMETLGLTWRGEPATSFSDDKLLGPSFYRIGRWVYDINDENNVQGFSLDTIIDMPDIRVDHVVFRVKSNWGGDATCLYRLRLHGQV